MRMLLTTTALAMTLGFPVAVFAQSASDTDGAAQSQQMGASGFLSERGQSDLFASELIGHDVHARPMGGDHAAADGSMEPGQDSAAADGSMESGQDSAAADGSMESGQDRAAADGSMESGQDSASAEGRMDGDRQPATITRADLETMDNIGRINDTNGARN